jgi:hypothetical protein
MRAQHFSAAAMTIQDVLKPKETGRQVVSHVLENVKELQPDFEAMKRILSEPQSATEATVANGERREGSGKVSQV